MLLKLSSQVKGSRRDCLKSCLKKTKKKVKQIIAIQIFNTLIYKHTITLTFNYLTNSHPCWKASSDPTPGSSSRSRFRFEPRIFLSRHMTRAMFFLPAMVWMSKSFERIDIENKWGTIFTRCSTRLVRICWKIRRDLALPWKRIWNIYCNLFS